MKTLDIQKLLSENAYPGRGIILGKSPDGKNAVIAYFIMGRSVNSRNRIFEETTEAVSVQRLLMNLKWRTQALLFIILF